MTTIHRLAGIDTAFLRMEVSAQPLHSCSLAELDVSALPGGYSFEKFRAKLDAHAQLLPEFRAKLIDSRLNFGTPAWVDDPDFDINRHVHRVEVSAPGGRAELCEVAARLVAEPMDRSQPLWDITIIEGISGADPSVNGRVAALVRTHHVFADGVTSGDLWAKLYDEGPPPAEGVGRFGAWTARQIAVQGMGQAVRRPWLFVTSVLPRTVVALSRTIRRMKFGETMSSWFAAPRTLFNGDIDPTREVAYVHLELKAIEAAKRKFGVKANDILTAVVSGALTRYLTAHSALPDKDLVAGIPVSHYDPNRPARNQLTPMFCSIHTSQADPAERVAAIAKTNTIGQQHISAIGSTLLEDWAQLVPTLFRNVVRFFVKTGIGKRQPPVNLTFSNVRGFQKHILGAPIIVNYPFGPIVNQIGLNITASTLNDAVGIGLVGCPKLIPDIWELAEAVPQALEELLNA
ncbi:MULTISPECIES: wax ester/triacylglycerol synthase family O-acyltransferase [Mycolicibacterium]|uniref:Diacylglycerol O-acyltransferase n=1 Tax=Mycolicibacterium senegalense TaxID=1796 RepID=A0A378SZT1_9MYCO|nr:MULTISPECIES: wax ester/triacylglycerol synthase family O-acyltransferase [Mycolicibacterium]MCV7339044.1 wax ester/triacylglycerol synthase family O-acyltransferase [Mycolicibacterium senegalense]MDR7289441.1 WS/DGAT/MGAT family acyltransferase [Mycolicibacterium senegalense]QZA26281.1 wax ester/triacylglycerol synthase family O-acyltransferase [Mycolicibacterium senegalense]CDP88891.1 acyltransferase, ws/dgat/mgat subfamily protein [Mycolicibacterium farcinogenes]STZ53614.1 Acyl-CoA acylt